MTLSTGYTGDGDDFGWIIPVPSIPTGVFETDESAFSLLEARTAPIITEHRGSGGSSCFPAGTTVLTSDGLRAIETIGLQMEILSFNFETGLWSSANVEGTHKHAYRGDMITIALGADIVKSTGNHPFFVVSGQALDERSLPADVSPREQAGFDHGRWVEARDILAGDILRSKNGDIEVTSVSIHLKETEVYNLTVADHHNYAIGLQGILVHNKGDQESAGAGSASTKSAIAVYMTFVSAHYDITALGATDSMALFRWLADHDFKADAFARGVLTEYIEENWAFVAVKLTPEERRPYLNEFLPPLTITYHHDSLIFPLRISSVSTKQAIDITLHVLAESTVASTNYPTAPLIYEEEQTKWFDPDSYSEYVDH